MEDAIAIRLVRHDEPSLEIDKEGSAIGAHAPEEVGVLVGDGVVFGKVGVGFGEVDGLGQRGSDPTQSRELQEA